MASQDIILIIAPDGTVEIEGQHFQGRTCDKVLRDLAEALGTIQKVEPKPEYFQTAHIAGQIQQTTGS